MADPRVISASELEVASPDERARIVAGARVEEWSEVPAAFRAEVDEVAQLLGASRRAGA